MSQSEGPPRIAITSDVFTFAVLYESARVIRAARPSENWYGQRFDTAAMLLSIFAVEAFFNHVGAQRISDWAAQEKGRSIVDKFNVLNGALRLGLDRKQPPFRTIAEMVAFRSALVHGKSERLTVTIEGALSEHFPTPETYPTTRWEALMTPASEERFFRDAGAIIREVHSCAGGSGDPLLLLGSASADPA